MLNDWGRGKKELLAKSIFEFEANGLLTKEAIKAIEENMAAEVRGVEKVEIEEVKECKKRV